MKWSFLLFSSFLCLQAIAQYPATGNKMRLGWQTTGDGLVYRGAIGDTATLDPSGINNAWMLLDTANGNLYAYRAKAWRLVSGGGGSVSDTLTGEVKGPLDSTYIDTVANIIFTTTTDTTVGVGELKYNDTQGSLIQGLKGGNVTNVIGQQIHQRVTNATGAPLTKGTAVFLHGSQGNRITVRKALATVDSTSANTFGIVAESIANNQSGYVITEGLITNMNTNALTESEAVYLSPTVAGELTTTKPQAPQHTVYIGVCVKQHTGSGELFVKIRNGQELDELHDVRITTPDSSASLYYNAAQGVWRDTGAAVLVADTSAMLTNYINVVDTAAMLTNYINIADTATMLSSYISNADTSVFARDFQISGTTNYLAKFTGSNAVGNSQVFDNGTNVGIGTASPSYPLHVNGTSYANTVITNGNFVGNGQLTTADARSGLVSIGPSSNTVPQYFMGGYGTFYGAGHTTKPGDIEFGVGQNTAGKIVFYTDNFAQNQTMTLTNNSFVGINTASPSRPLHVAGTTAIRIPVGTTSDRGTSANGDIRYNTTNANFEWYSGTGWREPVNAARSPAAGLANRFSKFDANGLLDTSAVLVQANGRIGIWNSPAVGDSALTVTGGIYTTNGVRVNNGISNFSLTPSDSIPGEITTLGLTHTATSARNSPGGISALALTAQTPSTSFTYGNQGSQGINAARIRAFHNASSTLAQLNGVNLTARNLGAGTVTLANGGNFVVGNSGGSATGVITNARGGTFTLENSSSATITNLYGAYFILINANNTAGSIGNIYGTYLEPITGGNPATVSVTNLYGYYIPSGWSAKATNKWSFYADDANAPLYSAGKIGAGVTTPQNALDVEGGAVIGATYSGTNTAPANGLLVQGETRIAMTADSGDYNLQVSGNTKLMGNLARKKPVTIAAATYTVLSDDSWLICNHTAQITITLPTAANSVGRELMIKYVAGGGATVISNATNVSPIVGGALTNIILPATAGSWVTLVCDGANWIIMQKG